ncbi:GDSL esterase/lipase At5g62930 [Andrographis paniculata]|uniref:GDSL esterase/lipase At5g62930 n=1 Tax=Andrographis paniculata TaxID=175694 RepID=UPI0021E99416|nr:GDSL esterase/lipase At5g62930 [Andrographis paniculata]
MRPQIVLFGDSITQHSFGSGGWGAAVADAYSRKADVVLRGYSGYNTRWALFLLNHIFPLGWEKPPIAATIFFGANDAALLDGTGKKQHVPVEEYKNNLRKMVEHIKSLSSKTIVVLITPPPIDIGGRREYARSRYGDKASNSPDRTNEITGIYAEECVALAEELGLPSVNLWSKMQEIDGWQKFLSDGLHLTSEGNAFVSKEVIKILDGAGFSDLPYDFPMHSDIDEEDPGKAFAQQISAV